MNEENPFSILQGGPGFEAFPVYFPEIGSANRSMLHRPSIPGIQFAHAQLLDLQDRHSGASESIFNDPEMLQDYLV